MPNVNRAKIVAAFFVLVLLGTTVPWCPSACGGTVPVDGLSIPPTFDALSTQRFLAVEQAALSKPDFGFRDLRTENVAGLKSPGKAVLLSVLLPGAGQVYTEARTRSRIFLGAEAASWVAYGGFKTWSNQKQDEFEGWAATYAGIDPNGKPDDFWRMMTFYKSRREYEFLGRAGEPNRASYPDLEGWDWNWTSEAAQEQYRSLRNQSKEADRKATFALGALVLNRVVSAIDAYRSAKNYNRKKAAEEAQTRWKIRGTPLGNNPKLMVYWLRTF